MALQYFCNLRMEVSGTQWETQLKKLCRNQITQRWVLTFFLEDNRWTCLLLVTQMVWLDYIQVKTLNLSLRSRPIVAKYQQSLAILVNHCLLQLVMTHSWMFGRSLKQHSLTSTCCTALDATTCNWQGLLLQKTVLLQQFTITEVYLCGTMYYD